MTFSGHLARAIYIGLIELCNVNKFSLVHCLLICYIRLDCSIQSLPKCLDAKSSPWKRRCPYEILLADKPIPSVLELDGTLFTPKLKIPKDTRPKKAKSWSNTSSGKPSPGVSSVKSPAGLLDVTDSYNTRTETRVEHFEMVSGV